MSATPAAIIPPRRASLGDRTSNSHTANPSTTTSRRVRPSQRPHSSRRSRQGGAPAPARSGFARMCRSLLHGCPPAATPEGDTPRRTDRRRRLRPASPAEPQRVQQPGGLGHDDEDGEVVGGERKGCRESPPYETSPIATQRTPEREERQSCEKDKEGIGARLLRIPDEKRIGRYEKCGNHRSAHRANGTCGEVDKRNGRRSNHRGERTEAPLPGPTDLRPEPCEHVVEVRGPLVLGTDCNMSTNGKRMRSTVNTSSSQ